MQTDCLSSVCSTDVKMQECNMREQQNTGSVECFKTENKSKWTYWDLYEISYLPVNAITEAFFSFLLKSVLIIRLKYESPLSNRQCILRFSLNVFLLFNYSQNKFDISTFTLTCLLSLLTVVKMAFNSDFCTWYPAYCSSVIWSRIFRSCVFSAPLFAIRVAELYTVCVLAHRK